MNDTTQTLPTQPDLEPLYWPAVNPKALGIDGVLFRCPLCRCLVIDLDRDEHIELAHPATVIAVVRLAEPAREQHAAA